MNQFRVLDWAICLSQLSIRAAWIKTKVPHSGQAQTVAPLRQTGETRKYLPTLTKHKAQIHAILLLFLSHILNTFDIFHISEITGILLPFLIPNPYHFLEFVCNDISSHNIPSLMLVMVLCKPFGSCSYDYNIRLEIVVTRVVKKQYIGSKYYQYTLSNSYISHRYTF